jgi:hypothetical protein
LRNDCQSHGRQFYEAIANLLPNDLPSDSQSVGKRFAKGLSISRQAMCEAIVDLLTSDCQAIVNPCHAICEAIANLLRIDLRSDRQSHARQFCEAIANLLPNDVPSDSQSVGKRFAKRLSIC